jgi:hypothetical protein
MSEPSIRKIKIPLMTPTGQKLQKKPKPTQTTTTQDPNILVDVARYMQKKYKILSTWKGDPLELLELCKTRSESKCLLELFAQSKKAVKKASKAATTIEPTTKTSKSTKTTAKKPLFTHKKVKRRSGSSIKQKPEREKKDEENTITEIAQRSK